MAGAIRYKQENFTAQYYTNSLVIYNNEKSRDKFVLRLPVKQGILQETM